MKLMSGSDGRRAKAGYMNSGGRIFESVLNVAASWGER